MSEEPTKAPVPEPAPLAGITFHWLRDLMVSVVLAIFVILFVYQPVKVEGTSMMPTLGDKERIFINKFAYRFGIESIQRGDMAVFQYPNDPSKSYIKRIIAVPGDTVQIDNGIVTLNGKILDEPYVPEMYRDTMSQPEVVVPPDHYYVLGDHRSMSNDSRAWGLVERHFIYGKAAFVYWPPERIGILP
jgi:signal peptidase I